MKIYNINVLKASKDYFNLSKKRKKSVSGSKTDRVEISAQAKSQASAQSLQNIIRAYLAKAPSIRSERVNEVAGNIRRGYRLNRDMLNAITEKILQNFRVFK